MLLVLNISYEKKVANVWDSETLLIKTWDLRDIIYHHKNIERLNMTQYNDKSYGVFKPVYDEKTLYTDDFVLFISKGLWAVHYNGEYSTKDISAFTEIVVPVFDRKSNNVNWVSGTQYGSGIFLLKLITIRQKCTRRQFKQKLLGLNGKLENFDDSIF